MLVSCKYCNGTHKRNSTCINKPKNNSRKKEANYITRFRSSRLWSNKRLAIKQRDKFLCQACKLKGIYTFNKLEVHHIRPIASDWNDRLNDENLITLCAPCHKLAESGEIKQIELYKVIYDHNKDEQ